MNEFSVYKTEGIILKKSDFGEYDWVLNIYTRDFGKIEIAARGVRKIGAKLKGHLELFNYIAMNFIQGKNFKTVTHAEIINNFQNSRSDLNKILISQRIVALAERLIAEPQKDEKIWNLLLQILNEINSKRQVLNINYQLLLYYFQFKLFCLLGYAPELYNCVECKKRLVPKNNFFSPKDGGIICGRCQKSEGFISSKIEGMPLDPDAIKILRLFGSEGPAYIKRLKISSDGEKTLKNCLDYFMEYHVGARAA